MQRKIKFITQEKLSRIVHWSRAIGYIFSMATFGLVGSSLGPILPDLAAQVSVPLNTISLIFTARAGGFLVGSFLGGRAFDRYKAHLFLVACFLLQALILAFTPFIKGFWLLVGILFLSGITLGFVVVGASTLIVWENADNPAPWVSTQGFLNGIGNFLSPLVLSVVISARGEYGRAYWLFALASLALAVLFLYTPSPAIRRQEKREVAKANTEVNRKLVYLVALIFLLYTGSEVTYNSWVFSMATTAYPLSDTAARLLNSLFWGALAIGRIFVGVFSRRWPSSRILKVAITGAAASFSLAILVPGSLVILWTSSISAGLCMAVIFPTLTLYAEKQLRLTGKMTSTFFMTTSIGGMLLPWVTGQFFTLISPHAVKMIVFAGLSLGLFVFQMVDRRLAHEK